MGCTESNQVMQNQTKPVMMNKLASTKDSPTYFLMGEPRKGKYAHICFQNETSGKGFVFCDRPLPQCVDFEGKNEQTEFRPKNYAQIVRIDDSSNKYAITGGINFQLDAITQECYVYTRETNTIVRISPMNQARYTHSSLFFDGWLYVVGGRYFGEDDEAILNKCERLYLGGDASQEKWVSMPSMLVKRCTLTAAIYNKKIYVLGGYTGQCQRSTVIQCYTLPESDKWTQLAVQMHYGIESTLALATNDNQLTILGGNTDWGPTNAVFTLNLLEMNVRAEKKLKKKRMLHRGFTSTNLDVLYILGGQEKMTTEAYSLSGSNDYKALEQSLPNLFDYFSTQQQLYSLSSSSATIQISYSKDEKKSKLHAEYDNQIFYMFGTSEEPFILEMNISVPYTCYHAVPLTVKLFALQGGVYLPNSQQCMIFGGISDSQEDVSAKCYLYSPVTGQGRQIAPMLHSRYAFAYQMVGNWVYAICGGSADEEGELLILNKCERINIGSPAAAEWESIKQLPVNLISPMSLVYRQKLYVFGGMRQNKQRYQGMLRYEAKSNEWVKLSFQFPFGIEAASIYSSRENQFLIFGGRAVNGDTKGIWSLTMISDGEDCVFVQKGEMSEPKCLHHIYQPKHQSFLVVFGGEKQPLSYYDSQSLKPIESDILTGLKQGFMESLSELEDKSLKNYLIISKNVG